MILKTLEMANMNGWTSKMPTNPVPTNIQVGPLRLAIEFTDNVSEKLNKQTEQDTESITYGCLVHKDQTIYLASGQKEDITADTLLHEILHAVWSVVGGWAYTDADEERIVAMLTGTLLDTFRRNKDLTRYLFDND